MNSTGAEKASSGLTGQLAPHRDEAGERDEHRHYSLRPPCLTQHRCTDGCRSLLCCGEVRSPCGWHAGMAEEPGAACRIHQKRIKR